MFITLSFVSFIIGFSAAIVIATRPSERQKNILSLWFRYRVTPFGALFSDDQSSPSGDGTNKALSAGGLLTKKDVESQYDIDSWQRLAYEDFKTTILAKETGMKTFPCVYATMGYRSDDHRYLFLNSTNPAEPQNIRLIGPALQSYLATAKHLGPNTSLVIVCAPSEHEHSVEDHNNNFWNMLRGLRIIDPRPWPQDVPHATESEKWTFCYDGQPIFPVMLTPAHTRRWSRHMSVPLIALQPKWVLDNLLGTPEKREAATSKVRRLLKEYDQIDISPDLTTYGQPGTTEARQLCLRDENQTADCPYQNFDT